MTDLAIIVPAYKGRFLRAALASIAAQTDQRFHLYVCDDGSADDLRAIFESSPHPAGSTFVRFDENVGRASPVKSWARAVALSSEPWVWLFSDDDAMDPECVAAFHAALVSDRENPANVYRFDSLIMDQNGGVKAINPPRPARESVADFIYHRVVGQCVTYAPDHIFRRAAYDAAGGFVEFPHAFGSDDASWIVFSGGKGLRTIPGARIAWRSSGINISSLWAGPDMADKLLGLLEFAAWLIARTDKEPDLGPGRSAAFSMDELVRAWFCNLLRRPPYPYSRKDAAALSAAAPRLGISARSMRMLLWQVNWQSRARNAMVFARRHLER